MTYKTALSSPAPDPSTRILRDVIRSMVLGGASFVLMALINIALLGWMVRIGGFGLTGIWALIQTAQLITLIADMGLGAALTRHCGVSGARAIAPLIARLTRSILAVACGCVALGWVLGGQAELSVLGVSAVILAALSYGVASGLFQVLSLWLLAPRLGRQQQYWVQLKGLVRLVMQAGAAFILLSGPLGQHSPALACALALLIGALAELSLAAMLYLTARRRDGQEPAPNDAPVPPLRNLIGGFAQLNLVMRLQEPVWRWGVGALGGPVMLGMFVIVSRLPILFHAVLGEALAALLPGLSRMLGQGDMAGVMRTVSRAIMLQVVFCSAIGIWVILRAPEILELWLGRADQDVVSALRPVMAAILLLGLSAPMFWTLQAAGHARIVTWITVSALIFFMCGAGLLRLSGQSFVLMMWVFAASFALQAVSFCTACLYYVPALRGLSWRGLITFLGVFGGASTLSTLLFSTVMGQYAGQGLLIYLIELGGISLHLALLGLVFLVIRKRLVIGMTQ